MNPFVIGKIIAACDLYLERCSMANDRIAATRIRQYAAALDSDSRALVYLSIEDLHSDIAKLYAAMPNSY